MRYARLEPIKKAANSRIKTLISFIVIIPAAAIIIGSIITKIIILPYAVKSGAVSNPNTSLSTSVSSKKKNLIIYILQAGAFSNSNNADMLKNAIVSTGEKAMVINDNNIYRVIIGIDETKDAVNKIKSKLLQNGYVCFINELKFGVESKDKNFTNYNDYINAVVYDQLMIEKKLNKAEIESVKNGVKKIEENFKTIKDSDIYTKKGKEIDAFNKNLLEIVNGYIKENDAKGGNGLKYIVEELVLIKNFYNSINEIKTNNNVWFYCMLNEN